MRRLATFCLAFALGVLAAQYFLPLWLLPYASAACALLGALLAWRLRDDHRRRALLIGLGLAIAKELAVGTGGDLSVGPNEGGGSVFTLVLPKGG